MDPLEYLWNNLLSRSPKRIRAAFAHLDDASKRGVIDHLNKMTTEAGWHPEQAASARAALDALAGWDKPNEPSP